MTRAAVLALALLAVACSNPATGGTPSVSPRSLGSPNPLRVQVTVDSAHSTTALIPTRGGKLALTLGDGTVVELAIPDRALLSDQDVTMTAVSAIAGMPYKGGLVASVTLAPEGLRLFAPATLTIRSPQAPAGKRLAGFGFLAAGAEFHSQPIQGATGAVTIRLLHFSGYGVAEGVPADAADHKPTAAEERAAQEIARLQRPDGSYPPEGVAGVLAGWYQETVGPALQAVKSDDGRLDAAVTEFLAWDRSLQMWGVEKQFENEVQAGWTALAAAFNAKVRKAHERCVANRDPEEAVHLLQLNRAALMLALDRHGFDAKAAQDRAQRCAIFELDFNAAMTDRTNAGNITHRIHARVVMRFGGSPWASGQGPEETVQVEWPQPRSCTITAQGNPATLQAPYLKFQLNFISPGPLSPSKQDLRLVFNPGHPTATVTLTCVGDPGGPHTFPGLDLWLPTWRILHGLEEVKNFTTNGTDSFDGYLIQGWDVGRGDPYARRHFERAPGPMSEDTTFEIHHAPQS